MNEVVVRCSSCNKQNRVFVDKIGAEVLCGNCKLSILAELEQQGSLNFEDEGESDGDEF